VKPLDFVKTPKGNIAIIVEMSGSGASIEFIGNIDRFKREKSAWWDAEELVVIDNLPNLLTRSLAHPFGGGGSPDTHFPINK
jgi:hypothetical protein